MPSRAHMEKRKKARSMIERRHEEQRLREEALSRALAKKDDPKARFADTFGLTDFAQFHKRTRKVLDHPERWPVLQSLWQYREKWVESLDTWKPRGKAIDTILVSLIKHLMVKYPMPDFWYSTWFVRPAPIQVRQGPDGQPLADVVDHRGRGINWFVQLAQGASLYKLIKADIFPVPLTKKQCHGFMAQRSVKNPTMAARYTQVQSFGGDKRLAQSIVDSPWGDNLGAVSVEKFRAGVIQWFCNQGMIDPAQVSPLIDYINHMRENENPDWSVAGRTGQSLMRQMEEWHRDLAHVRRQAARARWAAYRKPPPEKFDPSGIKNWTHRQKTKDHRGRSHTEHWVITEILTYTELREEGRELRHCVSSYAHSIARGAKAIFSLQCDRNRLMTIEVHRPTATIVQARGNCNKFGTDQHYDYMRRWAQENALLVSPRATGRRW